MGEGRSVGDACCDRSCIITVREKLDEYHQAREECVVGGVVGETERRALTNCQTESSQSRSKAQKVF